MNPAYLFDMYFVTLLIIGMARMETGERTAPLDRKSEED
jgi:hypothetical protein